MLTLINVGLIVLALIFLIFIVFFFPKVIDNSNGIKNLKKCIQNLDTSVKQINNVTLFEHQIIQESNTRLINSIPKPKYYETYINELVDAKIHDLELMLEQIASQGKILTEYQMDLLPVGLCVDVLHAGIKYVWYKESQDRWVWTPPNIGDPVYKTTSQLCREGTVSVSPFYADFLTEP